MVVPGMNLEFFEGSDFRIRLKNFGEMKGLIVGHLAKWPNSGTEICSGLRELRLPVGKQMYVVLFRRNGQRVALVDVFEIPRQETELNVALKSLRERYCKD